MSGMKMPTRSVRPVVGATDMPPNVIALTSAASSGVLAYWAKSEASAEGFVRP